MTFARPSPRQNHRRSARRCADLPGRGNQRDRSSYMT